MKDASELLLWKSEKMAGHIGSSIISTPVAILAGNLAREQWGQLSWFEHFL